MKMLCKQAESNLFSSLEVYQLPRSGDAAGCDVQARAAAGIVEKYGIGVLNSPGTIDADYRGEIGIILVNLSNEPFVVNDGDRIAQMVIARHERVEWVAVESLDETQRGAGGFGHTGR